ncbi:hypothetical protein GHK86_00090 [Acidimicrobiaceae bacterium USS-CC1]|uniref:Glycine cleavage system protein H n=1 Tax=Acidiferrimicrobium australe TaxID=2664430 RepID=A0ABW9QNS7_9ACTN|nr:hypothetical protein [Acidiferrimicrobium australe]
MRREQIAGFEVRLDVAYDPGTHLWVEVLDSGRVAIGLDPLVVESNGTLAAVAFGVVGTRVARGEPFGSLEAEKFVGPLTAPLEGVLAAANGAVVAQPSLVHTDPYGAWLVELDASDAERDRVQRSWISGEATVRSWFAAEVAEYRLKGVLAE